MKDLWNALRSCKLICLHLLLPQNWPTRVPCPESRSVICAKTVALGLWCFLHLCCILLRLHSPYNSDWSYHRLHDLQKKRCTIDISFQLLSYFSLSSTVLKIIKKKKSKLPNEYLWSFTINSWRSSHAIEREEC